VFFKWKELSGLKIIGHKLLTMQKQSGLVRYRHAWIYGTWDALPKALHALEI